jgi:hypothetical protein
LSEENKELELDENEEVVRENAGEGDDTNEGIE